ncbi:MAG TPA: hypothetical protein V6D22_15325 [Candidatus Obscuribacterales bacterium]
MGLFTFTVARSIQAALWDEEVRRDARSYWQHRRMIFTQENERIMRARRSNLLCNLVAFDPSKIAANLTITWMEPDSCDCVLTVNTAFQWLTDWNIAWLQLEMATFESFLLYNDLKGEVWEKFLRRHDIATLQWTMSGGLLGNYMSHEDKGTFLTPAVRRVVTRPAA